RPRAPAIYSANPGTCAARSANENVPLRDRSAPPPRLASAGACINFHGWGARADVPRRFHAHPRCAWPEDGGALHHGGLPVVRAPRSLRRALRPRRRLDRLARQRSRARPLRLSHPARRDALAERQRARRPPRGARPERVALRVAQELELGLEPRLR